MKFAALLALALVACGGAVSSGDRDAAPELMPSASEERAPAVDAGTPDARDEDAASFGAACVIGDAGYPCKPGYSWAWGDGSACFDSPCPTGSTCALLFQDAAAGTCE